MKRFKKIASIWLAASRIAEANTYLLKNGCEFVFELLELLKAHKKAIRRAAVNTFGYIAKAIG